MIVFIMDCYFVIVRLLKYLFIIIKIKIVFFFIIVWMVFLVLDFIFMFLLFNENIFCFLSMVIFQIIFCFLLVIVIRKMIKIVKNYLRCMLVLLKQLRFNYWKELIRRSKLEVFFVCLIIVVVGIFLICYICQFLFLLCVCF